MQRPSAMQIRNGFSHLFRLHRKLDLAWRYSKNLIANFCRSTTCANSFISRQTIFVHVLTVNTSVRIATLDVRRKQWQNPRSNETHIYLFSPSSFSSHFNCSRLSEPLRCARHSSRNYFNKTILVGSLCRYAIPFYVYWKLIKTYDCVLVARWCSLLPIQLLLLHQSQSFRCRWKKILIFLWSHVWFINRLSI